MLKSGRLPPINEVVAIEPFERTLAAAKAGAPWAYDALYRSLAPAVCGLATLRQVLSREGVPL